MQDIIKELQEFKKEIHSRVTNKWIVDKSIQAIAGEEFQDLYNKFEARICSKLKENVSKQAGGGIKPHPNAVKHAIDLQQQTRQAHPSIDRNIELMNQYEKK